MQTSLSGQVSPEFLEALGGAIYTTDADGVITSFNEAGSLSPSMPPDSADFPQATISTLAPAPTAHYAPL